MSVFSQNISCYHEKAYLIYRKNKTDTDQQMNGSSELAKQTEGSLSLGQRKERKEERRKTEHSKIARKSANGDSFSLEHCLDTNT